MFDKSAPGVSLTPSGDLVVNYARRHAAINDQIVDMSAPRLGSQALRIGVPGEFPRRRCRRSWRVSDALSRYPFRVRSEHFDMMSRDLRQGELNLLIGLSETGIELDARHQWMEPMVWVRSPSFDLDPDAPVPLVTLWRRLGDSSRRGGGTQPVQRRIRGGLHRAEQGEHRGSGADGLGVAAVPRSRTALPVSKIWEDPPLPRSAPVLRIYLSESADRPVLEKLADAIFA